MTHLVSVGKAFLRINPWKSMIEYSSSDGLVWQMRFCLSSVGTLRDSLVMDYTIIVATSQGLYLSRNDGMIWSTLHNNSSMGEFLRLVTDGTEMLASTAKGLYASRNQGLS